MTLYIRKLELCDENDEVIYRASHAPASEILSKALQIVKQKDGTNKIRIALRRIDTELANYFKI